MDIHFYFWITIFAFLFFMCLPLFILSPFQAKPQKQSSDLVSELKHLKFSLQSPEQAFYQVSRLFGATAYDVCLLGRQCYYELKFHSVGDSLRFKSQAVLAGICPENQITIIREKSKYTVIFKI